MLDLLAYLCVHFLGLYALAQNLLCRCLAKWEEHTKALSRYNDTDGASICECMIINQEFII